MPSNEIAKTKSAPRWREKLLLAGAALVVIGCATFGYIKRTGNSTDMHVTVDGQINTYHLKRAVTRGQQMKGLSDTPSLEPDRGMLFIYDAQADRCFWMKDMFYNLDIIWLDPYKKVTYVQKNLSPQTYPKTYCASGKYVIELRADQADQSGITPGKVLSF